MKESVNHHLCHFFNEKIVMGFLTFSEKCGVVDNNRWRTQLQNHKMLTIQTKQTNSGSRFYSIHSLSLSLCFIFKSRPFGCFLRKVKEKKRKKRLHTQRISGSQNNNKKDSSRSYFYWYPFSLDLRRIQVVFYIPSFVASSFYLIS